MEACPWTSWCDRGVRVLAEPQRAAPLLAGRPYAVLVTRAEMKNFAGRRLSVVDSAASGGCLTSAATLPQRGCYLRRSPGRIRVAFDRRACPEGLRDPDLPTITVEVHVHHLRAAAVRVDGN